MTRSFFALICLAVLAFNTPSATASTTDEPTQSAFGQTPPVADLSILSADDIALYQQIFAVQESGDWQQADKLIGKIDNDVLMGHVRFQRYMHPTKYRSKFHELRDWMADYADHPDAKRIYRLAMRRKPSNARAPKSPEPRKYEDPNLSSAKKAPPPKVSKEKRKKDRASYAVRSKIRQYLRRGQVDRAEKRLWAAENAGIMDSIAFHSQMSRIASSY